MITIREFLQEVLNLEMDDQIRVDLIDEDGNPLEEEAVIESISTIRNQLVINVVPNMEEINQIKKSLEETQEQSADETKE